MKKIFHTGLGRVLVAFFLLIAQFAAIGIVLFKYRQYFVYFYLLFFIVSIAAIIHINSKNTHPAYKLAWMIPIVIFPIFGGLFYILYGRVRLSRKEKANAHKTKKIFKQMIETGKGDMEDLAAEEPKALFQSEYIYNVCDTPPHTNTETEYLPTGEDFFVRLLEDLKKAKSFIFIEFFIIRFGEIWDKVYEVLEQKAAQGVDIRIIYDDFGCLTALPRGFIDSLEKKNIHCKIFNKIMPVFSPKANHRDHRKICVIDGNVGYTGGINIGDEYINKKERFGHWLDCGIRLYGKATVNLTVMFLSMWVGLSGEEYNIDKFSPDKKLCEGIVSKGYVQPFSDTPLDDIPVGENVYLNMINRAEKYVYICTPYLLIDEDMTRALTTAASSGIDVRITVPHIPDKKTVFLLTRSYYPALLNAGVKIYEYTPGFIHSKTFVSDDRYGVVGTINLDYRSLFLHYECAAWMYGTDAVTQMKDKYAELLDKCQEVPRDFWDKFPWYTRLLANILKLFAPLV